MVEGTEGCDDGNNVPGDGCGIACQVEPTCTDSGCTSECGDGLVLDEECDDGNLVDGDGCSSTCEIEAGSICENSPCEEVGGECVVKVPVIYRDFNANHIDMQNGAVSCENGNNVSFGAVEAALGDDGKPVFALSPTGNTPPCINAFGDWYADVPSTNSTIVGELTLFEGSSGVFVNRYQEDGSRFVGEQGTAMDGQPFFFPIDNHADALTPTNQYGAIATVNNVYSEIGSSTTWTQESHFTGSATPHNFHFTSEIKSWFRYDSSEVASLEFLGDDDVWVFINGKLVVDLGGLHPPALGSVTVSSTNEQALGLENGKVYPIDIFHAERKQDGSSFKLTLDGLTMGRSECSSNCGDGILGPDEECDDGQNDGGYNECQEGCVLGGYCGDGVVQSEEECDFSAADSPPNCTSGCRTIEVR
jgi:fibro-slime domain-containing protein